MRLSYLLIARTISTTMCWIERAIRATITSVDTIVSFIFPPVKFKYYSIRSYPDLIVKENRIQLKINDLIKLNYLINEQEPESKENVHENPTMIPAPAGGTDRFYSCCFCF